MRGVTEIAEQQPQEIAISTHTPHARRDINVINLAADLINFNSHASCEA